MSKNTSADAREKKNQSQSNTTTTTANTAVSAVDIDALKRENANIFSNIISLEGQVVKQNGLLIDSLRQWATNLEQLIEAGDMDMEISEICAYIVRKLREKGCPWSSKWAYKVLDDKYKQTSHQHFVVPNEIEQESEEKLLAYASSLNSEKSPERILPKPFNHHDPMQFYREYHEDPQHRLQEEVEEEQDEQQQQQYDHAAVGQWLPTTTAAPPNDDVSASSLRIPPTPKPLDKMSKEEFQRAWAELYEVEDKLSNAKREIQKRKAFYEEVAQAKRVAPPPEIQRRLEPKEPPVSTPYSQQPRVTEWYKAIERHIEAWNKVLEKAYRFPPSDKDAEMLAKGLDAITEMLKPYCDEKFRKDKLAWFLIESDNVVHGKHAAATMNYTLTPQGYKRALTREQVGDKFEETYIEATNAWSNVRHVWELFCWFAKYVEGDIAARAVNLHGKLSDKA